MYSPDRTLVDVIARFGFVLPFRFSVRRGDVLAPAKVKLGSDSYLIHPPAQSIFLASGAATLAVGEPSFVAPVPKTTDDIKLDGEPTHVCDLIQVDIRRDDFDRRAEDIHGELVDLGFAIANSWLSRIRVIAGAPWIRPLSSPETTWELAFLNDDGSDLVRQQGLIRRLRGVYFSSGNIFALKAESWDELNQLAQDFEPPTWDTLISDAYRLFPDPGPVVVLAMTAIETRIGTALDVLAASKGVPADVWSWFTSLRDDKTKLPTLEEELDPILMRVAGVTLKSQGDLWKSFTELRTARNKFAHQGKATLHGKHLKRDDLARLVNDSKRIVSWITDLLPTEHRLPSLQTQSKLEVVQAVRA